MKDKSLSKDIKYAEDYFNNNIGQVLEVEIIKKHLQEFKEELKIELIRVTAINRLEDKDSIIDTQMQKHFGLTLLN